ncbi:MAG: CrcB family protein [Planctomycetales bacterium]|nr:CrcB family protein [Planctomycetales bacterium]
MIQVISIAAAGALGALSRWGINAAGYRLLGAGFAWGTLIANVVGCFLLGFLMYPGLVSTKLSAEMRMALSVGFLGALTTFSTFTRETLCYIEDGRWTLAFCNIAANLLLGLGATMAGLILARTILGNTA